MVMVSNLFSIILKYIRTVLSAIIY
jgi:hypothetical protein